MFLIDRYQWGLILWGYIFKYQESSGWQLCGSFLTRKLLLDMEAWWNQLDTSQQATVRMHSPNSPVLVRAATAMQNNGARSREGIAHVSDDHVYSVSLNPKQCQKRLLFLSCKVRHQLGTHASCMVSLLGNSAEKGAWITIGCLVMLQTWHIYVCRARRIQNMGYTPDNSLWLSLRGGDVYFNSGGISDQFDQAKLGSRGFGILDVGYFLTCLSIHFKLDAKQADKMEYCSGKLIDQRRWDIYA